MKITCIKNNGEGESRFGTSEIELSGTPERRLSERIPALNFRLRTSDSSYSSVWHVAGDPTLLIILGGTIRIELRSGLTQDFSVGDMFIAQDYLSSGVPFDNSLHGHRAEVIGDNEVSALHLKLEKRAL